VTDILKKTTDTVLEAIQSTGEAGIPSGTLYAMLMTWGCTLEVYNHLIGILKEAGKITEDGFHVLRSK
jgi:hypothetical protein